MLYSGYVAEIDDDAVASDLDFDATDYQDTDAAIVAGDRIRLEWMEDDVFWAVTINHTYENDDGEFGTGTLECNYPSWEGRRNIERRESGRVTATFIANEQNKLLHELQEFWIDVRWTTGVDSGRLMFELAASTP